MNTNVKLTHSVYFFIDDAIKKRFSKEGIRDYVKARMEKNGLIINFIITSIKHENIHELESAVIDVVNEVDRLKENRVLYYLDIDEKTFRSELSSLLKAIERIRYMENKNKIEIMVFLRDPIFINERMLDITCLNATEHSGYKNPYILKHQSELGENEKSNLFVSTLPIEHNLSVIKEKGYDCIIITNKFITSLKPTEYFELLDYTIKSKTALFIILDFNLYDEPGYDSEELGNINVKTPNKVMLLTAAYRNALEDKNKIEYFINFIPDAKEQNRICGLQGDIFPRLMVDLSKHMSNTPQDTKERVEQTKRNKKK